MLAGGLCAWAWPARAQTFPSRLVRIVVPAVPAGGADILARSISDRLQALWRQTVIVENHTGGAGAVGAHQVMSANPDGYTLLMTATNTMMALVTETDKPYDVTHDLAPVTLVSAPPYLLVANPAVPATNAAELIAYAQQNPGKLTYGSSGVGSASHLSGALFAEMAGIKMLHVPYRGTGAVLVDLLAGRVNLLFSPALTVMPSVKAGELRVIGTTGTTRSALFPQYPTIAESGLPDYSSLGSFGLLAPAATPPGIVAKISADVGTVLRSDEVKERLAKEGAEPAPTTPAEFTSLVNSTIATWIALGRKAGIKFGE
jgi:tripartite-type tricarboxylate transporter receptor subunit TctC